MKQLALILCITIGSIQLGIAQDDPVLFTVGDHPVHVSEFDYIYKKTNGSKADYSEQSLQEYLDLYVNFKLKVQEARAMELDQVPALQQELAGYRQQLANTYLMDRQVMERLIQEAYERSQKDVDISHILISVGQNASPQDTLEAFDLAMELKAQLDRGADFSELAVKHSTDPSAKVNEGRIGYISVLQFPGFYAIENAAYNTPVNDVSHPVRTHLGYHLVKVNATRPARGEVEAAHILVRVKDKSEEPKAQAKINEAYRELTDGAKFAEIAKKYSEDQNTAPIGGYLGVFGIRKYETAFEDAVFNLEKDGDFSRPFHSSLGWHIIQRISKKENLSYEEAKRRLKIKIRNDNRFQMAQDKLVAGIKAEAKFKENSDIKDAFMNGLGADFLTYQWKKPAKGLDATLFMIGGKEVLVEDFVNYLMKNAGQRVRMARSGNDLKTAFTSLYEKFVNSQCIAYEESQLENKYPDFKALMREYEEGILLFEATKQQVWDKASQDSVGLVAFYNNNKKNYTWNKRARVSTYSISNGSVDLAPKIRKLAKKNPPAKVLAAINTDVELLTVTEGVFEAGQNEAVDKLNWKRGMVSTAIPDGSDLMIIKIEEVMKPKPKTLAESRGYVVADFQDFLEKKWVADLKSKYEVKINDDVFKGLVK